MFNQLPIQLTIPFSFEGAPAPAKINYEYFVLLSPDETIRAKTKARKKELHAEIGLSLENRTSVAHISLFKFMDLQDEDRIRLLLRQALDEVQSFQVDIDGLEVFDHGYKKSLVLTFKKPAPIEELNSRLLEEFGGRQVKITPHLTIARSVPNRDFSRIADPSGYFFSGGFLCSKVTVLRRPLNKRARYELFDEFRLCEAPHREFVLQHHFEPAA